VVIDAIDADDSFRLAFVETIEEQDVGPIGWAWLARSEGWQEMLAAAGVAAASGDRLATAEAEASKLRRRVDQLDTDRQSALARAQRAESATAQTVAELDSVRDALRSAETKSATLEAKVLDLMARVGAAEHRAARAEAALGAERKRNAATQEPTQQVEPAGTAEEPTRRVPIRSARGLSDDTPQGLRDLLALRGIRVLVDGYNVAMLGWPNLSLRDQRARLIAALANYAARTSVAFDVVFDGDDFVAADRTSTSPAVRVAWSPSGVTADDVIVDMSLRIDLDIGVVAVTDDNELRERLASAGCNLVGSRALVALVS